MSEKPSAEIDVDREALARAWDEGFETAVRWNGAPMCRNPYRDFPPGTGDTPETRV